jgi:hypothetical protein
VVGKEISFKYFTRPKKSSLCLSGMLYKEDILKSVPIKGGQVFDKHSDYQLPKNAA